MPVCSAYEVKKNDRLILKSEIYKENVGVAFSAVRSQLLRTVLTALIIAIGIMALVGILTAIDAIKSTIQSEFSSMGANTFVIQQYRSRARVGNKKKVKKRISYHDALAFKRQFLFPSKISVSYRASFNATIKYEDKKTNPNVTVNGIDEGYLKTAGYKIAKGRNITRMEVEGGRRVVVVGSEIAQHLFQDRSPIGKEIVLDGMRLTIIGVLDEKGSSAGMGGDRLVNIPLGLARQYFGSGNETYEINVMVNTIQDMPHAIDEAIGRFREIRKIPLTKEDDFDIRRSDSIASKLIENIRVVTVIAAVIGLITLFGAAIGLMNIMLVSVTERTHEIGVRKSLGASQQTIKTQFLIEAVLICQLGGVLGIFLGILIGNVISLLTGGAFIVPWLWILSGFLLCLMVGVISGYYPAVKAASLDPIEALRYE